MYFFSRASNASDSAPLIRRTRPSSANSPAIKPIPVAISEFSTQWGIDYGMMTTGGVIASIPPVLLAVFFQRYLLRGLTSGAVKG